LLDSLAILHLILAVTKTAAVSIVVPSGPATRYNESLTTINASLRAVGPKLSGYKSLVCDAILLAWSTDREPDAIKL
jgi:hypothetical protein